MFEKYYAPNRSREVEKAAERVRDAEEELRETLKEEYPLGARVRVVHYRGKFFGVVEGWDHYGSRVLVRNDRSGKTGAWWAAHVEVIT